MATYFLEMLSPSEIRPKVFHDLDFAVREMVDKQWQVNRFLYQYVGSAWGWTNRLMWSDEQWKSHVNAPSTKTLLATRAGSIAGYGELTRTTEGIEIAYFGLTPEYIGRGVGGAVLTHVLTAAWEWRTQDRDEVGQPNRVWVHTCDLDHPAALSNYEARGMRRYKVIDENI